MKVLEVPVHGSLDCSETAHQSQDHMVGFAFGSIVRQHILAGTCGRTNLLIT
jgi:hypothetical protein